MLFHVPFIFRVQLKICRVCTNSLVSAPHSQQSPTSSRPAPTSYGRLGAATCGRRSRLSNRYRQLTLSGTRFFLLSLQRCVLYTWHSFCGEILFDFLFQVFTPMHLHALLMGRLAKASTINVITGCAVVGRGVIQRISSDEQNAWELGGVPTWGGLTRGCANVTKGCQGALTDVGQLADGVIARGGDSEGLDNKGSDAHNTGCDNKRCASM